MSDTVWGLVVCGSMVVGLVVALLIASGVQRGVRYLRMRAQAKQIAREATHSEQAFRAAGDFR